MQTSGARIKRARSCYAAMVKELKANLIEVGPYSRIRHPMYTAVLFAASGFLAGGFTLIRLGAGVLLAASLLFKMRFEEQLLRKAFPRYADYVARTKRLLPGIY